MCKAMLLLIILTCKLSKLVASFTLELFTGHWHPSTWAESPHLEHLSLFLCTFLGSKLFLNWPDNCWWFSLPAFLCLVVLTWQMVFSSCVLLMRGLCADASLNWFAQLVGHRHMFDMVCSCLGTLHFLGNLPDSACRKFCDPHFPH